MLTPLLLLRAELPFYPVAQGGEDYMAEDEVQVFDLLHIALVDDDREVYGLGEFAAAVATPADTGCADFTGNFDDGKDIPAVARSANRYQDVALAQPRTRLPGENIVEVRVVSPGGH